MAEAKSRARSSVVSESKHDVRLQREKELIDAFKEDISLDTMVEAEEEQEFFSLLHSTSAEDIKSKPVHIRLLIGNGVVQDEIKKIPGLADSTPDVVSQSKDFQQAWLNRTQGIAKTALFWTWHVRLKTEINKNDVLIKIKAHKEKYLAAIQEKTTFAEQQDAFYDFYQELLTLLHAETGISQAVIQDALKEAEKYQGICSRSVLTTVSKIALAQNEKNQLIHGYLVQRERPLKPLSERGKKEYLQVAAWDGNSATFARLPQWFKEASQHSRDNLRAALEDLFADIESRAEKPLRLDAAFFQSGVRIGPGVANLFACDVEIYTNEGELLSSSTQLRSAIFSSPDAISQSVQKHISTENLQRTIEAGVREQIRCGLQPGRPVLIYARTLLTPTQLFITAKDHLAFQAKQQAIAEFNENPYIVVDGKRYPVILIGVNHVYNDVGRKTITGMPGSISIDKSGWQLLKLAKRRIKLLERVIQSLDLTTSEHSIARSHVIALSKARRVWSRVMKELLLQNDYGEDGHLKISAAESRLVELLGGTVLDSCMEGKDRTTWSKVNEGARILREAREKYVEMYNGVTLPDASHTQDYATIYGTKHHLMVTAEHCEGVYGSKKASSYLPREYVEALDIELGPGFIEHSKILAETFNQEQIVSSKGRLQKAFMTAHITVTEQFGRGVTQPLVELNTTEDVCEQKQDKKLILLSRKFSALEDSKAGISVVNTSNFVTPSDGKCSSLRRKKPPQPPGKRQTPLPPRGIVGQTSFAFHPSSASVVKRKLSFDNRSLLTTSSAVEPTSPTTQNEINSEII